MQGASARHEQGRRPAEAAGALDACFEPLAAIIRGREVESVHRGALAVVGLDGSLLGCVGDPGTDILLRSAAKPFQAAAVVASGAAAAFSLTDEEVAIMAASHTATEDHLRVAGGLLERAVVPVTALVCGPLEHMCSGKHAGMLLLARHLAVSPDGYQHPEHPVQQRVAGYIGELLEACPRRSRPRSASQPIFAGADNCGVPVIRVSLFEAAWLYASLAAGTSPALARVRDSMLAHPGLVSGEERFDTRLMRAAAGRVVSKGGAEGVQGIGVLSGGLELAPGLALKIEDGSARPIPAVTALMLRTWGLADVAAALEGDYPPALVDASGVEVGSVQVLAEEGRLRRPRASKVRPGQTSPASEGAPGPVPAAPLHSESRPGGRHLFSRKEEHVTVCRGDEKEVLRFFRDQWPGVDEEVFGRVVDWSAEPYSLVYRRDKRIAGVLKGHFIGGVASVDELMVAEGAREAGLGSMLLGRFEDEARRRGCGRIVLRAVKDSAAEDFYRGRGYHRECVQRGYEFGYDYVRLICDVQLAPGESGGRAREGKGS